MKKNKIIAIVGIALVVVMIAFSAVEAALANDRESFFGEWKNESGVTITINPDGTFSYRSADMNYDGTWTYSWFKLALAKKEGDGIVFKTKGNTIVSADTVLTAPEKEFLEPTTSAIFYSEGFFGYGEKGNFKYWSFAHFTPIILFALAVYFVYRYRDAIKKWKHEENFRFIFAAVMLFAEMSYFWRLLYVGTSESGPPIDLLDKLPLQVCEWTCIFAIFMITKKSKALYPICFYVCFTIGIFPLLTPSVITTAGPAYYRYYQYWLEHLLPPFSVFYMTFVHGFRPTKKGIIGAAGFMATLVVLALICNANIPGANYLYLAEGTTDGGGSIMDPIRNLVGGSTAALVALLTVAVIGIFFLAYYVHKWILTLSEKQVKEKSK